MTLEILICTIDGRIAEVGKMLMPQKEGVRYLVSWQQDEMVGECAPKELQRSDVRVVTLEGRGLSRNRNNALKHATGDVCLIADDDLLHYPENIGRVVEAFERDETLDIATFAFDVGESGKCYPDYEFDLREFPKGYYVTSGEIAFRRTSVQGRLQFDEDFGLGAPVLKAGEEGVFVLDALQKGLNGRYFPVAIARAECPGTGVTCMGEKGVVMANAAYLYLAKRCDFLWLRAMLMAWRVSRKTGVAFWEAFGWVREGIGYVKQIRKL